MARYAPCAEAARQSLRAERVHRRPAFASTKSADRDCDAESDAETESWLSMKVWTPLLWMQFSQALDDAG